MLIFYYTFGCKVNQYETELMKQSLKAKGHTEARSASQADFAVINTCTVTAQSDLKLRQLIHKIRRENPSAKIVLTGCYAQVAKDLLGADIIIGSGQKADISDIIENYTDNGSTRIFRENNNIYPENELLSRSGNKTRGIIKIQDGCDRFCSYCIIPYARGRSRSKPLEAVEREAKTLSDGGNKELVLVGINLSDYGKGTEFDLSDAVRAASKHSGRIRLGSLEPEEFGEDIIKKLSEIPELCPHFHLALQSGCDKTLREMRRKYSFSEYAETVNCLRKYFNGCAVTTDIMVGFPGESDEDFSESLRAVKEISFADMHVFPYSAREGTAAAKRSDQIPKKVKEERAEIMAKAAEEGKSSYQRSQVGSVLEVLFEREKSPDFHQGHSRNYQVVRVKRFTDSLFREIRNVMIEEVSDGVLWGKIV